MNILRRFTLRSLRENKTRTLVTIIGIILSMSMFTAVIVGAYSGIRFLIRSEEARSGAFHGMYYDIDGETAQKVESAPELKDSVRWREVGWAKIDTANDYKPYILIQAVGADIERMVNIELISGRLPENESEILMPIHIRDNEGPEFSVGDVMTFDVGRRISEGWALNMETPFVPEAEESIEGAATKSYTIVGIYERLDRAVENRSCPGYIALTSGEGTGNYGVFFTLKNPAKYFDFADSQNISANLKHHSDLLMCYGTVQNGNIAKVIYGLAIILVLLISFGSISLIYNSFSISVSERTRNFGILKSVGATPRQIRASVLYEAFILSLIGIPAGIVVGCGGMGLTLYLLRDSFSSFIAKGSGVSIRLEPNFGAIGIAALICLITVLTAAVIPAKKAMKTSPIQSIRQSDDIKIRPKDVRTWRLGEKIFGFEGMMAAKNFKRNRKRYRSTVVSLFLSVTLFIAASSFCSYLKSGVEAINSHDTKADLAYYSDVWDEKNQNPDETLALLASCESVSSGSYARIYSEFFAFDESLYDSEYAKIQKDMDWNFEESGFYISLVFLDDASFKELCRENGIDPSACLDAASPRGLVYNKAIFSVEEEGGRRWYSTKIFDERKLPAEVYMKVLRDVEGYALYSDDIDESGNRRLCYYDNEYYESFLVAGESPDESKALMLSPEEAELRIAFTAADVIDKPHYSQPENNTSIFYPHSAYAHFAAGIESSSIKNYSLNYYFITKNHSACFAEIKEKLMEEGLDSGPLINMASMNESIRKVIKIINVFSYGFIVLISLIAAANVFNTISTNINLRRREIAMLRSCGLSQKGFYRMMNFECVIYGLRGLMFGLPASVLLSYLIFKVTESGYVDGFYVPWHSIVIASGSVFAVVFTTMLYASAKIRNENPIDALKCENL